MRLLMGMQAMSVYLGTPHTSNGRSHRSSRRRCQRFYALLVATKAAVVIKVGDAMCMVCQQRMQREKRPLAEGITRVAIIIGNDKIY